MCSDQNKVGTSARGGGLGRDGGVAFRGVLGRREKGNDQTGKRYRSHGYGYKLLTMEASDSGRAVRTPTALDSLSNHDMS